MGRKIDNDISRRQFLKYGAGVSAATALAGCGSARDYDSQARKTEGRLDEHLDIDSNVYVEDGVAVAEIYDGITMDLCKDGVSQVERKDMQQYLNSEDDINVNTWGFHTFETHLPYAAFTFLANDFSEYMPHHDDGISESHEQAIDGLRLEIEDFNGSAAVFEADEETVHTEYYTKDKPMSDDKRFTNDFLDNFDIEC